MLPIRLTHRYMLICVLAAATAALTGCGGIPLPIARQTAWPEASQPAAATASPSLTPFQPLQATPTPSPKPLPPLAVWLDAGVPPGVVAPAYQPFLTEDGSLARLQVSAQPGPGEEFEQAAWIFALAGPFPTLTDEVSADDFMRFWRGESPEAFPDRPLLMDSATRIALEALLGPADPGAVSVVAAASLVDAAYAEPYSWAVLPFEALEARWKVITIDGQNPLRREFDPSAYLLAAQYTLSGDREAYDYIRSQQEGQEAVLGGGNRDPDQMTVLLMTGVTALVRATGWMMDTRGVEFPASDIGDLLRAADITHISNEVSFTPDCPPADPGSGSLRFCSDPDYFNLLTFIGTDIVELSGNHVNDWGLEAMSYSLDLYRQAGIPTFAGGANIEEARQAVILEDHGNRLAFIGCNQAGPAFSWAGEDSPGSAPCDLDWMESEIRNLRNEGILPVVTFQFEESYSPLPMPWQTLDFRRMADAGAVLVSGSQAHSPQIYEFHTGNFIHYGPGNLFFDQMNIPGLTQATRWEFLDRYVIYQGRLLGVEIITAMLEDWSRPRLMTAVERHDLLAWIFDQGGWNPEK